MKRSYRVRARIWMVVLASATLVVTGCAGSSQGTTTDASDVTVGVVGDQNNGGEPRSGGTVSFATYNGSAVSIRLTVRTAALPVVAKWQPSTTFSCASIRRRASMFPTWLSRCRPTATTRCGH